MSVQAKKRKLLGELDKIDKILSELSTQRKQLEDNLQQIYYKKYLPIISMNVDDENDGQNNDKSFDNSSIDQPKQQQSSSKLIKLDLDVPMINHSQDVEDDDDDDNFVPMNSYQDDDDDDDDCEIDDKEKLRKLFSELQQF